jgi:hypothetical protein
MEITETELIEFAKVILAKTELEKPKAKTIEQNEKEELERFKKMGYRIVKPFTKVLPIRNGKRAGELVEFFGYVMKRDRRVFAKVFTTQKRNKLENVWA